MGKKIFVMISLVMLLFMLMQGMAKAQIPATQRQALIDLYNSTGGDNWVNTQSGTSSWIEGPLYTDGFSMPGTECDWYGVTCDTGKQYVERIELADNNLVGTIPDLSGVTTLLTLDLHGNSLSGSIPATLGNIITLVYLSLYGNDLSGTIPSALNDLVFLDHLNLSDNNLYGTIPDLSGLIDLDYLNLGLNSLSGDIPSTLGDINSLVDGLYLYDNDLTGSIPSELGNLTLLLSLDLSNNQLSGTIPPELGGLDSLEYLYLNGNKLEGPIPGNLDDIDDLVNNGLGDTLTYCDIRWNALYTSDNPLSTFFTNIQTGGDWESYQTVAPTGLNAGSAEDHSMTLTWTAIAFQGPTADNGGYEISYRPSGGSWGVFELTAGKAVQESSVTGLISGTSYNFRVRTLTEKHANNPDNDVYSHYTDSVSATTTGEPPDDEGGGCFINTIRRNLFKRQK